MSKIKLCTTVVDIDETDNSKPYEIIAGEKYNKNFIRLTNGETLCVIIEDKMLNYIMQDMVYAIENLAFRVKQKKDEIGFLKARLKDQHRK